MSNEEFQKIVLEALRELKEDVNSLKEGQKNLETKISSLEKGQKEIKNDVKSTIEQTADLTEFREENNEKLDLLLEDNKSIHGILGEHEVSIRTLRRKAI